MTENILESGKCEEPVTKDVTINKNEVFGVLDVNVKSGDLFMI